LALLRKLRRIRALAFFSMERFNNFKNRETPMNITFFELEPWEKEYMEQKLKQHKLTFVRGPLSKENAEKAKTADCIGVFVHSDCSAATLKKLLKLKYVVTLSTGYDHIDGAYCMRKGITAMNVPKYGENTVAEFTFALILALTRKLYPAIKRVKEENEFICKGLMGMDLKGKTIGIFGTGNIGEHVIRIANGFEMKILACCHNPKKELTRKYGVRYVSSKTLLSHADILSLHIPYTPQNHHIMNKETIGMMKKGALLINTARGGLIETDALYRALKNKHLGGAAVDVLEQECEVQEEKQLLTHKFPMKCNLKTILENHQLMKMDNVIVTPHSAWYSKEGLTRILDTTIENIGSAKKRPKNRIA